MRGREKRRIRNKEQKSKKRNTGPRALKGGTLSTTAQRSFHAFHPTS